ncbi:MAG: hypothetical protein ABF904_05000 [Ethanoligenens sp.]
MENTAKKQGKTISLTARRYDEEFKTGTVRLVADQTIADREEVAALVSGWFYYQLPQRRAFYDRTNKIGKDDWRGKHVDGFPSSSSMWCDSNEMNDIFK